MQWIHWRAKRPPYPIVKDIRLHLGCGDIDYPGFVNIDARPQNHVHHVQRIDELSKFVDNSVTLIYGSHCLEHISHKRVVEVLKEWHRALKPSGVLRVSVPDFDLLLDIYLQNNRDMQSIILPLMGEQDYSFNFHYTAFTFGDLSRLFSEAGFRESRRWQNGTEQFTSLPDWSGRFINVNGRDYPVSLNMEAIK
jgi:predicted SAM-dependent methyltransferase